MPICVETEDRHALRCQLTAGIVLDLDSGIVQGCTVAKAGVRAVGHVVMLDKLGAVTRDEKLSVRKVPAYTDQKTLTTLMAAAAAGGNEFKAREDHDETLAARIGFTDAFKLTDDGRVVTDLHVFEHYSNRKLLLETIKKTPKKIGLSIDFLPSWEIVGDKAFMRIDELEAVDVVDGGAITPDGMFLNRRVDTARIVETEKLKEEPNPMLEKKEPTNEEVMSAISSLSKIVTECMATVSKLSTPPADTAMAALKTENEKLRADLTGIADSLKAVVSAQAQAKKERALLGFRGTDADRVKLAAGSAEDIEKITLGQKSYLQLVADLRSKNPTMKASDAHDQVRGSDDGKIAYREHLSAKGITGRETMAA